MVWTRSYRGKHVAISISRYLTWDAGGDALLRAIRDQGNKVPFLIIAGPAARAPGPYRRHDLGHYNNVIDRALDSVGRPNACILKIFGRATDFNVVFSE
jgi:hypothetical protein